ncbi:carotenoid oxygenase [Aureobasidium sp. EXF-10727]|nr:carotenoid oxygenase [Aureobasidium sp. EXF-10727]KAI4726765.1 carotenoid oxygenase [Aureobasidium sp. EXF-10728]
MPLFAQKTKRSPPQHKHAYLSGNFAPINQTLPLTKCTYSGIIPSELAGGEYVRNGGNPVSNEDLGRDAHWFDGDGMLSGVSFTRQADGSVQPEFVNQYILTDVFLSTAASPRLRSPILPSIATLVNPLSSLITIVLRILRTIVLVILSFLPGSTRAIKRISVANTAILYHDGRALATCESGPPMRIALPGLETVGWYDGNRAEGEPELNANDPSFSGKGLLGFLREWTTAHPKVDPITREMMLFHSTFLPPYVQYSIIPPTSARSETNKGIVQRPVPGITGAKMMHDFGVSLKHTIIMDLPLSLDPFNLAKNKAVIEYDPTKPARFGVFPRHHPEQVKYFETTACCIFHTANAWDDYDISGKVDTVHLLTCRLTSASLVFSAGNIAAPQPTEQTVKAVKKNMPFFSKYNADETCLYEGAPTLESPGLEREPLIQITDNGQATASYFDKQGDDIEEILEEDDQCRLYHYAFSLKSSQITAQYALSAISFEFPSVHPDFDMQEARYVYGCTTSVSSFNAALGRSVKIDALAKIDTKTLIEKGDRLTDMGKLESVTGCVDTRTVQEIVESPLEDDPIQIFRMPAGWFAQEPRFIPRKANPGQTLTEDDGYLIAYAFDESQLGPDGEVPLDSDATIRAKSELWIIDAKDMRTVVGRVALPQRVPYGLHGSWFPEEDILNQKPVDTVRSISEARSKKDESTWMDITASIESMLS